MHIAMKHYKPLDARTDPGDDGIERNFELGSAAVVRIAHEQEPHRIYELKILKQQSSSDLEYFTYQMTSTHNCSDDAFHDC